VLDPQDEDSRAIAEFNDRVLADERLSCVLLPIRDGVTLIRTR
jgi:caffeoyl-CoA O-methyltransferase